MYVITLLGDSYYIIRQEQFITLSGDVITLSGSYYIIRHFYYIIRQLLDYRLQHVITTLPVVTMYPLVSPQSITAGNVVIKEALYLLCMFFSRSYPVMDAQSNLADTITLRQPA